MLKKITMLSIIFILLFSSVFSGKFKSWDQIILNAEKIFGLYNTSSELKDKNYNPTLFNKYGPHNLFDNDYKTSWVEGVEGPGIGESIHVVIENNTKMINIFPGYGENKDLFIKNNRPKKLKLSVFVGINPRGHVTERGYAYKVKKYNKTYFINLKDQYKLQNFKFPFDNKKIIEFKKQTLSEYRENFNIPIGYGKSKIILKIEIEEVYKGTSWDDTCISEIYFGKKLITNENNIKYNNIERIYTNDKENCIIIDTEDEKNIELFKDESKVYQIIDTPNNIKWATVISMVSNNKSRKETKYFLLNALTGKKMNKKIENIVGSKINGPFFIKEKNNKLMLEFYQNGMENIIEIY